MRFLQKFRSGGEQVFIEFFLAPTLFGPPNLGKFGGDWSKNGKKWSKTVTNGLKWSLLTCVLLQMLPPGGEHVLKKKIGPALFGSGGNMVFFREKWV